MTKTILTCAVTGNITRPDQTPYLPITPAQIADDCIAAYRQGAAIVHIHVRDPETGAPSMAVGHYRETVERIRDVTSDLILNLTTGPGQRFLPSVEDPSVAAEGTNLLPPAERVPHVLALQPEVCTLDLNTMASGNQVIINIPRTVEEMARLVRDVGVKPELELFSSGDLVMARDLMQQLDFSDPLMVSFVMGIKYGWPPTVEALQLALSLLPEGAIWTAFGVGRHSFPMVAQSVLLGGHIRVGLEDNLYLSKGELAEGNGPLCEKAVRIVRDLGGEIASPQEARALLGLGS
ncbi:3-keto-5-aminohexanoate cleavage protein [Alterisphingorhabdus coralli]|uniref:3-keto-5-aminohexanoate cleavage protein n=1 Tax=Alterisphingorhabdus coralli TaxID=3071408 RepID=A0AA97F795_9SPHN|nr:3-keto-5-aminohexanoate cleavage protein [Parasphingorhabdus sp. SCSIO 66989]WOE75491.1 3-keto-5-aminohexanoate cleavage protein [Parasphingorhabdus sp. SCSIO 66989]